MYKNGMKVIDYDKFIKFIIYEFKVNIKYSKWQG